ncbi:hypothetical protein [Streptomyces sp. NPDC005970]|uniref:hypothetical protein n=1 Tax=Streptomyces sp. NPDC005970 TaxID=3156723 RepID=UPI003411B386
MGTDISGVIEIRAADGRWETEVGLLDFQLGRDRSAWECLFGFGNSDDIQRPLFDSRGLPPDASDWVRETGTEDFYGHSHTCATWAEVAAIDWDAPLADGPARYWAARWRPGPTGELVRHDVVPATVDLADAASDIFGGHMLLAPSQWPPGGEVPLDGAVYRPVVLTARMLVPPDEAPWAQVWQTMRELAADIGAENVRLVVWFG